MKLEIYNWKLLKKYFPDFPLTELIVKKFIQDSFAEQDIDWLNIIFVSSEYIKDLNLEFREKDSVTDVLSFDYSIKPLSGEVYVCPEYVSKDFDYEEILRDIIHGILHITGYDHDVEFSEETKSKNEMFVKQENILQNILDEINNGAGKSRNKISKQ